MLGWLWSWDSMKPESVVGVAGGDMPMHGWLRAATAVVVCPWNAVQSEEVSEQDLKSIRLLEEVGMGLEFSPGDAFIGQLKLKILDAVDLKAISAQGLQGGPAWRFAGHCLPGSPAGSRRGGRRRGEGGEK